MQPTAADLARRMEFVRQAHDDVADKIRRADAKAGGVAAVAVALLNVLTSRARSEAVPAILSFDTQPLLSTTHVLLLVVSAVACAAALLFAYFGLRPRLSRTRSYVAFPELARMTPDEYLARVEAESDAGLIAELTRDTIALAAIALRKNQMIERAVRLLIGATVGAALVLIG